MLMCHILLTCRVSLALLPFLLAEQLQRSCWETVLACELQLLLAVWVKVWANFGHLVAFVWRSVGNIWTAYDYMGTRCRVDLDATIESMAQTTRDNGGYKEMSEADLPSPRQLCGSSRTW
jgi:hypothetical protein